MQHKCSGGRILLGHDASPFFFLHREVAETLLGDKGQIVHARRHNGSARARYIRHRVPGALQACAPPLRTHRYRYLLRHGKLCGSPRVPVRGASATVAAARYSARYRGRTVMEEAEMTTTFNLIPRMTL